MPRKRASNKDDSGNVIERPGSKLRYDAKGRLRRVEMTDGAVVSYRYDHSGRRVVKETTGPKGSHRAVYVDRASEERDGQFADYVFAGDVRVARIGGERPTPVALAGLVNGMPPALGAAALILLALGAASAMARTLRRRARALVSLGATCALLAMTVGSCNCGGNSSAGTIAASAHYHGDHLAGVALQTDERGEVTAEVAYDPYGGRIAASNEPYGFTGKEYEADTGLYDFGARTYDPVLGRFLSPDPATLADPEIGISDPQLLNPYAYARNAPTGHVDPDGKLPHIVAGALAGGAIGGGIYLVKAAVTGEFSARSLAGSVAGGAIAGGVAAATCGASLVVQGTAAGFAGGIAQRGIETASLSKTFEPKAMAVDTALGAAAGPALKLAGKGLGAAAQRAAPVVKAMVAKAEGATGSLQGTTAAGGVVDPAKFRYLFGEAGGDAHNVARTVQNAGQMARVGVYNTAEGRALLQSHFESVVTDPSSIVRTFANQYGTFQVRESLFAGPGGFVKFESTWQVIEGGGSRFTTAIPFGGP